LDYLKLGQSSTTLSGGDGAADQAGDATLVKRGTGRTLYILDEPTTGLHFEDIRRLLEVICRVRGCGEYRSWSTSTISTSFKTAELG
jgi:excinuclease ABC subunit A